MYRLYKITKDNEGKDVTSRDEYTDVYEAEGNFEFQKGLAMENNTFAFLMLLNNDGSIHTSESNSSGVSYITTVGEGTIKPRLFEVKTTTTDEPKSYGHDTAYEVSADFYKRLGAAKQNAEVRAEMLRGVDEHGNQLEYEYWVRPIEFVPEPVVEE